MQKSLGRPLLWAACRHHIGEVILTCVWEVLCIEVSKSPDITLFDRLRTNFELLSYSDVTNLNKDLVDNSVESLDVVRIINDVLQSKTFAYRGDYIQFLHLVKVILTGDVTDFALHNIGAVSKARWMAKTIGASDIFLLTPKIKTELPKSAIATNQQLKQIQRFVKFVALVYCKWWIRCPVSEDAPVNDLDLIEALQKYPDSHS